MDYGQNEIYMEKLPTGWWIALLVIGVLACDTLEDDMVPASELDSFDSSLDEGFTTYTSSGEEVLIDLLQGIKASENISIAVDKAPAKGEAELLNDGILRYLPYPDFTTGKDWLVVALSNSRSTRRDTIEIIMSPPQDTVIHDSINQCIVLLRYDSIVFTEGSTAYQDIYYLDILANDQLCDHEYSLLLPEDNLSLMVENGMIAYNSPDQQDISFSYTICLTSDDTCYEGSVAVRFGSSCVPRARYDSVFINHEAFAGADTISIDVRQNDQTCDNTPINIYQPPSRGDAWVEDNRIMYAYTVEPGTNYGTSLKYQYGTLPVADSVNRALVSIEVRGK